MTDNKSSDRRRFLKWTIAAGASAGLATQAAVPRAATTHNTVQSYRQLGRTGLEISDISFGTSRLRSGEEDLIRHALDRGINYFDSAYGYTGGASEVVLGKVFKGMRDKVVLVSKNEFCGPTHRMLV